jgi:hypothetical protein
MSVLSQIIQALSDNQNEHYDINYKIIPDLELIKKYVKIRTILFCHLK